MQPQEPNAVNDSDRLSTFELAGNLFGLNILNARAVLPLPRFTPLPNSGDIYFGVFNQRGEIFPLIDVSPVLGLPPKQILPDDMVILLEGDEDLVVGMLVDNVQGVLTYTADDIEVPHGTISSNLEIYVKGVLRHNNRPIHILDLETLLKTRQILAHY